MEKRTEEYVKAAKKLEAARGLAGMHRHLVNSFFGKFGSSVFLPNAMKNDALKEKGKWSDDMIEG